jgi:AraC family transcriptional regulator
MAKKFDLNATPSLLKCKIQRGDAKITHSMTWDGGAAFIARTGPYNGLLQTTALRNEFYFELLQRDVDIEVHCDGYGLGSEVGLKRSTLLIPSGASVSLMVKSHRSSETLAVMMSDASLAATLGLDATDLIRFDPMLNRADETDWLIARLIYEECKTGAFRKTRFAEYAATTLGISLMRHHSREPIHTSERRPNQLSFAVMQRTCDFMESGMETNVSLTEVAAVAGLSLSRFASCFKESTGLSPQAWLRQRRIARAKQLLRDPGVSVNMTSLSVGYSSQSSFGVAFRRGTGLTPSEWRKQLLD